MPTEIGLRKTEPIVDVRLAVKVNNQIFDNWKNVSVVKDMDQSTDTFSFSVGPLFQQGLDWVKQLNPGSLVEIMREDKCILRGFIDTQSIKSSGTDESLEISGRDVMGLLVDSSIGVDYTVKGKNLKTVATEIIKPFTVHAETVEGYAHLLRYGSKGEEVKKAQTKLKSLAYYDYKLDGIFASITKDAVIAYQKDNNLKVDGIIGPETGGSLGLAEGEKVEEGAVEAFAEEVAVRCENDPNDESKTGVHQYRKKVETDKFVKKPAGPSPGEKCEPYLRGLVEGKGVDMWVDHDAKGTLVIGHYDQEREKSLKDAEKENKPKLALFTFRSSKLTEYNNFKDTQVTHTIAGRFSTYKFYGKKFGGAKNTGKCSTRDDRSVEIFKPSYTKIDKVDDVDQFDLQVEAAVSKGMSARYQLNGTAVGYGQRIDGDPYFYDVNQIVDVIHEVANIKRRFYISKVTYSCDASSGPQTSITLRLLDPEYVEEKE